MIADIPSLFSDIIDGKPAIPYKLSWALEADTKFFMQWYGKPVKMIGGKLYKWEGEWVKCTERGDSVYYDARNCGSSVEMFVDENKEFRDGYYWMVGEFGDNPYGFRMPMLIPADCFAIYYNKPITYEGFREYFMLEPNIFGVLLCNNGRYAHVDGHGVGLDFRYGEEVRKMREDIQEKKV